MAVGLTISNETSQKSSTISGFVLSSCMVSTIGGLNFGYDLGISVTVVGINLEGILVVGVGDQFHPLA